MYLVQVRKGVLVSAQVGVGLAQTVPSAELPEAVEVHHTVCLRRAAQVQRDGGKVAAAAAAAAAAVAAAAVAAVSEAWATQVALAQAEEPLGVAA